MKKFSVVSLHELNPYVVQITMQDRINKNTFSPELVDGLSKGFNYIRENKNYKAVILTGYDSYFCSGGTQQALLSITEGNAKFTDADNLYSLPLDCEIPVISAMQGHAIGGGFAMGLFADFIILSRESVYTTNFMKYGFTPGMGATLILPQKLGFYLGGELLLTAGTYRGAELEKRGIPCPVLPRKEVLNYSCQLANQLAEKPRTALITLKDHLVSELRRKLPEIIEKEVAMHEKTFCHSEVKENIINLFGK